MPKIGEREEGTFREVIIERRGLSWTLRRYVYAGKCYLGITLWRKWSQDGEFHPSRMIKIPDEIIETEFIPALQSLYISSESQEQADKLDQ